MDCTLLKKKFGELKLVTGYIDSTPREIEFKENALTISGVNIDSIFYGQDEPQTSLPPSHVRDYEYYLLGGRHSIQAKNIDGIVSKYNLNERYSTSFFIKFNITEEPAVWIAVSSISPDSPDCIIPNSFKLEICNGNVKSSSSGESLMETDYWHIPAGENRLLEALKRVCNVAEAIHDGKLSEYIEKINRKSRLLNNGN